MGVFPSPATIPVPDLYPEGKTSQVGSSGGELEVTTGRRAFTAAQARFAGAPIAASVRMAVGWHDTSVSSETGSFAVVRSNAGLDDYVGEIVRVTLNRRVVFAYVLDVADVPVDVSVTRRLFLALSRLTLEAVPADVVAVG